MSTSIGNNITGPIECSARNTAWNPMAGTTPHAANEDNSRALLAEVQMLQKYVCELLRKNQELRYALSGMPVAAIED